MSLHAQLSPEAVAKLKANRRNSSITAIITALLGGILIALMLAYVLIQSISKNDVAIIDFGFQSEDNKPLKPTRMNQVERPPAAPSRLPNKFIDAKTASPFSIQSPKVAINTPSLELGDGNDFGKGFDQGDGSNGGKPAGGWGSPEATSGTLPGYLYDFKQTNRGRFISDYDTSNRSHFTDRVNALQRARFSQSSLRRYFRAPQQLNVRYIAIPFSNASDGPKFFQAEKLVQPSGWVAHYSGQLKVPASGTYRLVGSGDDYMSVTIDRKTRLVAAWTDIAESVAVRGANADEQPNHRGPFNIPLTYGSWFELREGDTIDVDIAIGERPGGKVGFVLMLEKKGENYRQAADGRKILPPFVFGQLEPSDLDYLETFPGWQWDTDNIITFQAVPSR